MMETFLWIMINIHLVRVLFSIHFVNLPFLGTVLEKRKNSLKNNNASS